MRDEHALPKATAGTLGGSDGALRLVTKGLVFVLVGGLAIQAAAGLDGDYDPSGALVTVARGFVCGSPF